MQLFVVKADGEVHEIISDKPFKELLDPKECYIINDDDNKIIYLWKGSESSVRSKFIGASKSQEVRGQVGMHYKVVPIDEGDEPPAFLEKIDEAPQKGFAKEIKEEKKLQFEVPGVNAPKEDKASKKKPAPKPVASSGKVKANFGSKRSASSEPKQVMSSVNAPQNEGPLYQEGMDTTSITSNRTSNMGGSATSTAVSTAQPSAPQKETFDFKKVMETLESLEIPKGYEREMIIIGNQAYSIVEKKVSFLGTEKVEKVMEKIGSLPEGVFFAKGYAPRVLCENQKVLAIEFLKRKVPKTQASKASKPKKLKVESSDPKELAKSFGMKID
ncbi:MAG: hypothetical protein ACTSU2_05235 [Promethearchaeota archaeon]